MLQAADTVSRGEGGRDLDIGAAVGCIDTVEGWIEGFIDSLPSLLAAVLVVVAFSAS